MPTEHEFKFILHLDVLGSKAVTHADDVIPIRQGYIADSDISGMTLRVRHTHKEWILTLKRKVPNGKCGLRVVEIEQRISKRDGADLFAQCAKTLRKKRHIVHKGKHTWEIDIFYDPKDEVYFALAEVECREGEECPQAPGFLRPYVLYQVPLTDSRFSNKNLVDVEYARKLYQELLESRKEPTNDNGSQNTEDEGVRPCGE
jgi:CYTH domain-containing protein